MNKILTNRELLIKRLAFRSWHRGCKETDLILGNFADVKLAALDDAQLAIYDQLLGNDDDIIWRWLTDKEQAPEEFSEIISMLKLYGKVA